MQRTGLIHISSMTAVCEAPRADRLQASTVAGDPPWKTHLLSVCKHEQSEPRLRTYERGGVRALMQCLNCGQKSSNFISVTGVNKHWDVELENRVKQDYEAAKAQWDRGRIEAYEDAKETASRQWWSAYDEYRGTSVWAVKRELVFERCNGVCESCGQRRAEHVHHKKYPDVFGLEPLFDLVGVCVPCHKLIHPHME